MRNIISMDCKHVLMKIKIEKKLNQNKTKKHNTEWTESEAV